MTTWEDLRDELRRNTGRFVTVDTVKLIVNPRSRPVKYKDAPSQEEFTECLERHVRSAASAAVLLGVPVTQDKIDWQWAIDFCVNRHLPGFNKERVENAILAERWGIPEEEVQATLSNIIYTRIQE